MVPRIVCPAVRGNPPSGALPNPTMRWRWEKEGSGGKARPGAGARLGEILGRRSESKWNGAEGKSRNESAWASHRRSERRDIPVGVSRRAGQMPEDVEVTTKCSKDSAKGLTEFPFGSARGKCREEAGGRGDPAEHDSEGGNNA